MVTTDNSTSAATSVLSPMQIAALMGVVGWKPPVGKGAAVKFYDTAIAIALAESGGNARAVSSTKDYGLWQIHVSVHDIQVRQAIFEWTKRSPKGTKVDIFDPRVNTDVARMVYQDAHGFKPWSTYNNGAYKKYLGHGAEAVNMLGSPELKGKTLTEIASWLETQGIKQGLAAIPGGGIVADKVNDVQDVFTGPEKAARLVVGFLAQSAIVIGAFTLGALIIILGVVWLLKKPIANTAADVMPGGKLIKTAAKVAK